MARDELASHKTTPDAIVGLNRLFIRALRMLGEAGEEEAACRLAAEGWSLLRHDYPDEAYRLNGTLHYLTNPAALQTARANRGRQRTAP